ncbi:flagellar protein FlaG [Ornithinibacillus xuwenensis]|uniref:Flagellar protein FlaG n=1 Tax=Ornithinibacillus xuwenensis TaxID=3144668 RepID=A0ABU9XMH8_9BACI
MRVDSFITGTQPLQNSNNNSVTSEIQTVVQDNQQGDIVNPYEGKPSKNDVKMAVDKLNDFVEPLRTNLKFELHDELNEYYVTIVNPDTNEVIKEIPSKKVLDMYAAMADYMGFLIDKKI